MENTQITCNLCGTQEEQKKPRLINDKSVCKKCHNGQANGRQLAFVIDWIFLSIIAAIIIHIVNAGDIGGRLITVTFLLLKDGINGVSLGKKIMGFQTINITTGEPIGFRDSFLRNLPLLIPIVPLIIAFQLSKGSRWGEGWTNTRVIWNKHKDSSVYKFKEEPQGMGEIQ